VKVIVAPGETTHWALLFGHCTGRAKLAAALPAQPCSAMAENEAANASVRGPFKNER
jgi:hypothetical protein